VTLESVANLIWTNPRESRLRAEIQNLRRLCLGEDEMSKDVDAATQVRGHLDDAEAASGRHDIDAAWQHLFRAHEQFMLYCTAERLASTARTVEAELTDTGKFTRWRRLAITKHLAVAVDGDAVDSRCAMREALRLRNEAVSNQYWRLSVGRHYQYLLLGAGAPTLIAVVSLMIESLGNMRRDLWPTGAQAFVLCVLLGVLGATTSAAQRSAKISPQRMPTQLGAGIASLSRLPIGGVAGITVWLFSMASTSGGHIVAANMLLAAFGAGFAERLVVQSSRESTAGQGVRGSDGRSAA
jgi:hypothetical protein